jgi:hypothetical protein
MQPGNCRHVDLVELAMLMNWRVACVLGVLVFHANDFLDDGEAG